MLSAARTLVVLLGAGLEVCLPSGHSRRPALAAPLPATAPAGPRTSPHHAYHSSITELRLNPQARQVELAIKVFTDDLEKALSQGQPRAVDLRSPVTMMLTDRYLQQRCKLFLPASGHSTRLPLELKFLGLQAEKDAYWLYAKAALPRPSNEVLLRQAIMLDLFPDQSNIINAEGNGKKLSALFRTGHEEQVFTF